MPGLVGRSMLDTAPSPADTRPLDPGRGLLAMPLFRVFTLRRRDRRRRPRVLWWRDPPDAGPIRTRQIGPMSERHREAWQAELNGFHEDLGAGATWEQLCAGYLAAAAADLKPATVSIYRQVLARFEVAVGPRMLAGVDRRLVETYRVGRLREVSQETARKDLRHLRAAFAWAVNLKMMDANPCVGIRFGRRERFDVDAMSEDETRRFLASLAREPSGPTWLQASLRLACLWGPRAGELAGILREDLDLAGRTLRLPATRRRGSPKGGRGRVVPLDEETAGLLQELSHRTGPILWGAPDKPFRSAGARGGYTRTLGREARRILEVLGVRPHDDKPLQFLRRTAETNMRRRGVPDRLVGEILGHGTRVGDQFYDGRSQEDLAREVARIMSPWVTRGSSSGPGTACQPSAESP